MSRRDREANPSVGTTLKLAIALVWSAGRRRLLAIVVSTVVTAIAVAGQLLVGRRLLDLLVDERRVGAGELAPYLVALGILLMVSATSQALSSELRLPLLEAVFRNTMDEILDVGTEVELDVYEGPDFHDRLQRATYAAGGQVAAIVFGMVTMVSALFVAFGVVAVLFAVAPILVPAAVIGYLPIALVNVRNNRARYKLELELTENQRERLYLEHIMTDRDMAKEVRAYDIAPTLRRWHAELWDTRMMKLRALVRRRLGLTTVGSLVTNGVLVVTLALTLVLAGRGSISVGDAAVAIVGLQQLSSRLQSAGAAFNGVHQGMTFLRDFETFRATLPAIRARRPTGVPPAPPSVLSVDKLTYRYPGATVDAVHDVSFDLNRGQVMAIVGANGSGKTTLSKLLCQLLKPNHGSVSWNGVDLAGCDPSLVRAQIAPVFQDFARYHLTVRQTIGLGDTGRLGDDAAIRTAAARAGMEQVIDDLPNGLETRLGKAFSGGVDFSIGQWQRLAIARALFRDARGGDPRRTVGIARPARRGRALRTLAPALQRSNRDLRVAPLCHGALCRCCRGARPRRGGGDRVPRPPDVGRWHLRRPLHHPGEPLRTRHLTHAVCRRD